MTDVTDVTDGVDVVSLAAQVADLTRRLELAEQDLGAIEQIRIRRNARAARDAHLERAKVIALGSAAVAALDPPSRSMHVRDVCLNFHSAMDFFVGADVKDRAKLLGACTDPEIKSAVEIVISGQLVQHVRVRPSGASSAFQRPQTVIPLAVATAFDASMRAQLWRYVEWGAARVIERTDADGRPAKDVVHKPSYVREYQITTARPVVLDTGELGLWRQVDTMLDAAITSGELVVEPLGPRHDLEQLRARMREPRTRAGLERGESLPTRIGVVTIPAV
nr:hypothetical protein [Kofleriaceae bacterium]